jgi:2'-5' RNA ligase superfamily
MSRGVVLWPDDETTGTVTDVWAALEACGIPTLASHTHRRHRPHVSLVVADDLDPDPVLEVLGSVPGGPLRLLITSPGVFPGGILFLTCVPNAALLDEQRRVHDLVAPMAKGVWEYCTPGAWSPHLTNAYDLDDAQLARALPVVLDHLPIEGWLTRGGVEDGDSGERWPAGARTPDVASD